MNKFYSLIASSLLVILTIPALAQVECSDGRYTNRNYFTAWDTTENILFGSGPAVGNGQTQQLKMCVFQPEGDQLEKRPLVVFTFGGSFVTGTRQQVYPMCEEWVKMGYVVAATDYRVGFFFPNQVTTTKAVMRGMHDMKAAIRYFYKDAQTTNVFKIDTNRIIVGGVSAGAISAIHTAYMTSNSEIPSYMYSDTAGMGGVEGNSGNPGYSSKVHGVIDFSGTVGQMGWINWGEPPLVGLHDLGDQTVPYGSGPVSLGGFPTGLDAHGTGSIIKRLDTLGIPNAEKTYPGSGHVAYLQGSQQEWDEAVDFAKDFIADLVCGNLQNVSVEENNSEHEFIIAPNPSTGLFNLQFNNEKNKQYLITLTDITGREIINTTTSTSKITLDCTDLSAGTYIISLSNSDQRLTKKVIIN